MAVLTSKGGGVEPRFLLERDRIENGNYIRREGVLKSERRLLPLAVQ